MSLKERGDAGGAGRRAEKENRSQDVMYGRIIN